MQIAAFYTINTPYEKEIENLKQSCEKFNYPIFICSYASRGSWVKNCAIKPEFILEAIDALKEPFVYIDADGVIRKTIDLSFPEPIGVHFKNGRELLSGTIFVKPCARDLVVRWVQEQQAYPEEYDQRVLDRVIKKLNYPVCNIPAAYTKIFDSMQGEPIIEHFQASRRFKPLVRKVT